MNIFKIIIVACALMASLTAMAGVNTLTIKNNDGTEQSVTISDRLIHTFTATHMLVGDGGKVSIEIPRGQIASMSYGNDGTSGMTAVGGGDDVRFGDGFMSFSALEAGSRVTVCTLDGKMVFDEQVVGEYTLDFANLPKGVNIVKINNNVYKIIVR